MIPHKRGVGKRKGNLISVGAAVAQKYLLKGILMGGINPAFIEKVRQYFSPHFEKYSAHIKKIIQQPPLKKLDNNSAHILKNIQPALKK